MKNIMCFGDSNTWGFVPGERKRFTYDIRWPGVLQGLLGSGYYIIEEGLSGRTTAFDDPVGTARNGIAYVECLLHTHKPLDMVVVMLGTNDCKDRFSASAHVIANGLERVCRKILDAEFGSDGVPKLLIVAPVEIGENIDLSWGGDFSHKAIAESKQLPEYFKNKAELLDAYYLNAQEITAPDARDSLHLGEDGHKRLAEALAVKIKSIFGDNA